MPDQSALFWLAATTLLTGLMFLPYVLERIFRQGLGTALGNPIPDEPPAWAARAAAAHRNAIENLVVFAVLLLVANHMALVDEAIATAAMVYFWARFGHFVVYSAGIPVLRTLLFFAGLGAQLLVAWKILGG